MPPSRTARGRSFGKFQLEISDGAASEVRVRVAARRDPAPYRARRLPRGSVRSSAGIDAALAGRPRRVPTEPREGRGFFESWSAGRPEVARGVRVAVAGGAGMRGGAVRPRRARRPRRPRRPSRERDLAGGGASPKPARGFEAELHKRAPRRSLGGSSVSATIAYEHGGPGCARRGSSQRWRIWPRASCRSRPRWRRSPRRALRDLLDEVPAAALGRARHRGRARSALAARAARLGGARGDGAPRRPIARAPRRPGAARGGGARRAAARARSLEVGTAGGLPHLDLENPLPRAIDAHRRATGGAAHAPVAASRSRRGDARAGRAGVAHGDRRGARPLRCRRSTSRVRRGWRVDDGARSAATATIAPTGRASRASSVELARGRHEMGACRLATPSGALDLAPLDPRAAAAGDRDPEPGAGWPPRETASGCALDYARAFIAERPGRK